MTTLLFALLSPAMAGGMVVVDLVDDPSPSTVDMVQSTGGFTSFEVASDESFDEGLYTGWSNDPDATIAALQGSVYVEAVELDQVFTVQGQFVRSVATRDGTELSVNDPDYDKQWHMRTMSSEYVWEHTKAGKGVVVAILDTGFTLTKDFNPAQVLPAKSFIRGESAADGHGHGTHCASTVAQATNNGFAAAGLARDATILPGKVLSNSGSGSIGGIAAGIDWAVDQKADIISMSLGGGGYTEILRKAMDRAIAKGVIIVAAAGNSGGPHDSWPAGYGPVISIGSLGPDGLVAPYSSYPKSLDLMAPGGNKRIAGGGVFQWIKFQGTESLQEWQGTSMATPHAAAAAAILLAEGAPHEQVKLETLMVTHAKAPVDKSGKYGKGQIDLEATVKSVKGTTAGEPPPPPEAGEGLPYPNPAGKLTFVITTLAAIIMLGLQRVYKWSPWFFGLAASVAIASSGPLYALTMLPISIPGLAFLMVPWIEVPDYLIGQGISGCPLWLSCLPLLTPFFVLMPLFPRFRPVIIGVLVSTFTYLTVDTAAHFNPVWWMTAFGSSCWLGINALLVAAMLFTTTELHLQHSRQ